jgi:glucosamine--fructose-6-phosphate aminotransferase (isomerizing)
MSLSYSQAFHPMEYRHGPISLVDQKTFALMMYSTDTLAEEAKVAGEIRDKGAYLVGFGGPGDLSIPVALEGPQRALAILPALQILGERVAGERGLDTVAPRHLNKVVVLS